METSQKSEVADGQERGASSAPAQSNRLVPSWKRQKMLEAQADDILTAADTTGIRALNKEYRRLRLSGQTQLSYNEWLRDKLNAPV